MRRLAIVCAIAATALGCGGGSEAPTGTTAAGTPGFELSAAVGGEQITPRFTCDGDDVSPKLTWKGTPGGTRELAVVLEDPDAPGGAFTHWLVYGLPADATSLPENVPAQGKLETPPLRQGRNDFGDIGYRGPCPPVGERHRYTFRLLALDSELGLEPVSNRGAFEGAIEGHVIAEASAGSSYGR